MLDRPEGGERALLVQILPESKDSEALLAEFEELANSAGAIVLGVLKGARARPDAKYYIGLGKAEELGQMVEAQEIELVLVNHELTPSQERNLERLIKCRVVDRSGLILDIFAKRARTFEGKLQVELAQLQHLSTRLVRGWTHLERQKGGIGLRGPGETQLETDRRLLRARIKTINKRLEKVRSNRDQNRRARQKALLSTVSLVGYTNAGKSSLFNAMTGAKTHAEDQLFATLDPTMRKLELPGARDIILADTVGFIRDLPHGLIEAFHATLEETKMADLLLHVIDYASPTWREEALVVDTVLKEIGLQDVRIMRVFNKIDLLDGVRAHVLPLADGPMAFVSAKSHAGLDLLCEAIAKELQGGLIEEEIVLMPTDAKLRAQLFALGAVQSENPTEEGGWRILVRMSTEEYQRVLGDLRIENLE